MNEMFSKNSLEKKTQKNTGVYINKTAHQDAGVFFALNDKKVKSFFPEFITNNPGSENQSGKEDEYIELNPDQVNGVYKNLVSSLEESKVSPESFLFRLERLLMYLNTIKNEKSEIIIQKLKEVLVVVKEISNKEEDLKKIVLEKMKNKESRSGELSEIDELKKQIKDLDLSDLLKQTLF